MRLTVSIVFSIYSVIINAQDCEDLQLHGLWLDPFNDQKINLLCSNLSSDEIYSYPHWIAKDEDGNVISEEEVMYFGIAGSSYHVMDAFEPWQDANASVDLILELWTGFGEQMACSVPWIFNPTELLWTGTGIGGCFPVTFNAYAYGSASSSLSLSLVDGAGNTVLSQLMVFDESTGYQSTSDSLCIAQDECYLLTLSSDALENISIELVDPSEFSSWNMSHWTFQMNEKTLTELDTTFQLDLYGGDCTNLLIAEEIRPIFNAYPNPSNGLVQINPGVSMEGGRYYLFESGGRLVREDVLNVGQKILDFSDIKSGSYQLILFKDGQQLASQLLLVEAR
tara:strand:+ start:1312 stop:2325 length:1014 start_codon:yes stop_codon:yes gene_type:complete